MVNCTICCQNINDEFAYTNCECNYVYHSKCLKIWFDKSLSCPTCRKVYKPRKNQADIAKLNYLQEALFYESIGRYNQFRMNNFQV